jgi:autotransporter-associated beta strand protein
VSEATLRGFSLGAAGGGFEVTGGPLNLAGVLADLPGQRGVLNKTGAGTLSLTAANTYTGNTVVGGGTLAVSADANLGDVLTRGDIFLAPGATLSATGSFTTARNLFVGAGAGDRTVNVTGANVFTLIGVVSQPQASATQAFPLVKTGPGVFVLASPANALTGLLTVNGGELRVTGAVPPANTVSSTGTGADNIGTVVNNTGALGGTGVVNRLVQVNGGGAVSPGLGYGAAAAGTLTVEAASFAGGSQLLLDLRSAVARPGGGPSDVNTNDRLAVRGGLTFATGTTNLTLRLDGTGQTFAIGSAYDYYVASAATVTGFDPAQVTIAPDNFAVGGSFTSQLLGSNLVVTFVPVPEPGLLLVPAAVAAFAARRRARAC